MKENTYKITFLDANGNQVHSKAIERRHIEEVEAVAFFILNFSIHQATTFVITEL
jgi:hypothetical protein